MVQDLFYVLGNEQWGIFVTDVKQGENAIFTFPVSLKSKLLFYWGFDVAAYFYNIILKNKNLTSCYAYATYPNGTEQVGDLAPTGVKCMGIFIGI